jgi:F0F1-type ATP synthase membrane subunit a
MMVSNDVIIYSTVFILGLITFYAFWKIGVKRIASEVTEHPVSYISVTVIVAVLGFASRTSR